MNSNWQTFTIGEISKVITGKTPPGTLEEYFGGETLFVTPTDMNNDKLITKTNRTLSNQGESKLKNIIFNRAIVVSCIGWQMGKSAVIKQRAVSNQQINSVLPDETKIDLDFLYYVLSSKRAEIFNLGATATRTPILKKSLFEKVTFDAPSLPEQRIIGQYLSTIDDKIALNTQTNQTLEAMAQALFKSWFVDFDPVKAKMRGEQPVGMDAATAVLFPNKLVESELGLIPEGWEVSSLGKHFRVVMGQSPKGDTYNEEGKGTPFFQGRRDFGFRYPSVRVHTTDPKRFAKKNDTLISVRAPVGDKNMAAIDCCVGRGVATIKHNGDSRSFTYAFMSYIENKLQDNGSSGTVFSSINKKELDNVPFVAPPDTLISQYHSIVDSIDQQIEILSMQTRELEQLRDILLPKLLSGELILNNKGKNDA